MPNPGYGPYEDQKWDGRTYFWEQEPAGRATRNRVTAYDIARDGCSAHGGCLDAAVCLRQGFCTRAVPEIFDEDA